MVEFTPGYNEILLSSDCSLYGRWSNSHVPVAKRFLQLETTLSQMNEN